MTIDMYYMYASPPCRSVILAAKALGVELNLKYLDAGVGDQLKPEYLKINPQHTIPTIVDDGFILFESRSILAYLVNKYGKDDRLYPTTPKARAVVDQRLYFDMDLVNRFSAAYLLAIRENKPVDEEKKEKLDEGLLWLDEYLDKTRWAAGDEITIADFALIASITTMEDCKHDITRFKSIMRWYRDCQENMIGCKEVYDAGVENLRDVVAKLHSKLKDLKLADDGDNGKKK